jgi:hypothetical protein
LRLTGKKTDEYRESQGWERHGIEEGKKFTYAVRRTDRDPSISYQWAILEDESTPDSNPDDEVDTSLEYHATSWAGGTFETISFLPVEKRMVVSRLSELTSWAGKANYDMSDVGIDFTVCSVYYD